MTLSIENKLNLSLVWGIWKKDGALIFHLNRGRDELCWVMDMTRYLGNVPAGNMSSWGTLVPDTICFRRQLIFLGDVDSDVGVRAGGRAWCRGFSAVNRLTDGDDGRVCCRLYRAVSAVRLAVGRSVGAMLIPISLSVSQSVKPYELRVAGVLISSSLVGGRWWTKPAVWRRRRRLVGLLVGWLHHVFSLLVQPPALLLVHPSVRPILRHTTDELSSRKLTFDWKRSPMAVWDKTIMRSIRYDKRI